MCRGKEGGGRGERKSEVRKRGRTRYRSGEVKNFEEQSGEFIRDSGLPYGKHLKCELNERLSCAGWGGESPSTEIYLLHEASDGASLLFKAYRVRRSLKRGRGSGG